LKQISFKQAPSKDGAFFVSSPAVLRGHVAPPISCRVLPTLSLRRAVQVLTPALQITTFVAACAGP